MTAVVRERFLREVERAKPEGWLLRAESEYEWVLELPADWPGVSAPMRYYSLLLHASAEVVFVTHGNSDAGAFLLRKTLQRGTLISLRTPEVPGFELWRSLALLFSQEPPNQAGLT